MKMKQGGYLIVDHRAGPGLPREVTERFGMPPCPNDKLMEADTYTCSHCPRVVIINHSRTRPRAYCPKCDGYVCDFCEAERVAAGYVCNQTIRRADEHYEAVMKGLIGWPDAQSR